MRNDTFSNKGYLIIKNAIRLETIERTQLEIINFLNGTNKKHLNNKRIYLDFCRKVENLEISEFDFCKPIYEFLFYKGLLDTLLLEKRFYNALSNLLGKDLSFVHNPSLVLNLPNKNTSKENYLFKDWHQEIWSGAGTSTIQIWTPLFQKGSTSGQIELILNSHTWGHVPHRNRAPIELPEQFKTTKPNLEYGDVLIFSTLVLHRTDISKWPRLALPMSIKNFKYKDNSFQENLSWKIFSHSELTKIERALGNHYLSPFRTTDLDQVITGRNLKKR